MFVRSLTIALLLLSSGTALGGLNPGDRVRDFGQPDCWDTASPPSMHWVSDFTALDGVTKSNRLVLVAFSASFCAACWKEFPELLGLAQEFGSKGLVVWVVLVDQEPRGQADALEKIRKGREHLVCSKASSLAMPDYFMGTPHQLPGLYLVDQSGKVLISLNERDEDRLGKVRAAISSALER